MTQEAEIQKLCKEIGLDKWGLSSARNFLMAAIYHRSLPGTLPADKHVAINSALRFASGRLTCGGRHGAPWALAKHMSVAAANRRAAIRADITIPAARKIHRWKSEVTFEHRDPVSQIEHDIFDADGNLIGTIDDIILRLLKCPPVIILRTEEKAIKAKSKGTAEERYRDTRIEITVVEQTSGEFFGDPDLKRVVRRGKYFVPDDPFEA
ncbi:hypothetical protein ABAC460_11465 [Asticcacaulis sp. AC460]|uniref:hypothetical protein n=1 Tax=Asticcacaulis sp. AC460 TaxID=1282360 RepID=UPI0003C3F0FF|nr:hypothetical protein [Asticcacaulis sp. AC460]ESQ89912.1 hypothetical protein ABAC460_11465 [Asticcacaulis sp. AC460]